MNTALTIHLLNATDILLFRHLNQLFALVFNDAETYTSQPPDDAYLRRLLSTDTFIAITALYKGEVIGGLAGYTLHKFEQARSEFYIYDLVVAEKFRRQGVATELVMALKEIAAKRGIYIIFVQADQGDDPAISLYTKLGVREDVLHFDITPSLGASAR